MTCEPRWATARTPGRETLGAAPPKLPSSLAAR